MPLLISCQTGNQVVFGQESTTWVFPFHRTRTLCPPRNDTLDFFIPEVRDRVDTSSYEGGKMSSELQDQKGLARLSLEPQDGHRIDLCGRSRRQPAGRQRHAP